jgi:hypothetical protein
VRRDPPGGGQREADGENCLPRNDGAHHAAWKAAEHGEPAHPVSPAIAGCTGNRLMPIRHVAAASTQESPAGAGLSQAYRVAVATACGGEGPSGHPGPAGSSWPARGRVPMSSCPAGMAKSCCRPRKRPADCR